MKFKSFKQFVNENNINEAKRGTIHKAAKKGSYPAVVVVIENGKVIHQEKVVSPEHAPAVFNVMQEKYPKAKLSLEDNTGQILFQESVSEATDLNDPVLIRMRNAQKHADNMKKLDAMKKEAEKEARRNRPRWTQKKYDKWLEMAASNGGAENAFDMAKNAEFEPGLIDWVEKNFRGDDPLQRIQWDIEGFAESVVNEKREDVGKYNTVKKVIAKLGRRPSEQDLAQFITDNYYDVTEVERGEDDPSANDKIADLVAFYKFDIEDWNIAWFDAQNESVVTESNDETGLMIIGRTRKDNNEIGEVLDDLELHGEWDMRAGFWFLPEEEEMFDELESMLDKEFTKRKINARFEGVFESVVTESIRVGKVVAIKKYNPKTNRKEVVDVRVTDYIKKPGSKDFVEYDLKGKKRKVSIDVFKSIMESNTAVIHNEYDFVGMHAAANGMTREEYTAHFLTPTIGSGIDEAKATDHSNKSFEVKGIGFTYTEQRGRFYGAYLYDVAKTANVQWRAKLRSIEEVNTFLKSAGVKGNLPERYDERELDKLCKEISKKGIVCDHDDHMDVS